MADDADITRPSQGISGKLARQALRRSLAVLRRSVRRGRPVPLPTLLRHYRRQLGDRDASPAADVAAGVHWLSGTYRALQPFGSSRRARQI